MRKKILAGILALVTFMSVLPAYAEGGITVYLSLSRYGELVSDKDGNEMAYVPVELSGKDSYNLDDAFTKAHELYYDGGDAYASEESNGLFGITKLWGDTSGNFGYQVNHGSESVGGLGHEISDGDYIDAVIYKSYYPDMESYSAFDKESIDTYTGEEFELTLNYVSGYDEYWNNVFSPCSGAVITVNGEETEYITDEGGKAYIEFDSPGQFVVSAVKNKVINEAEVPAITAPVCVVNIKEHKAVRMIHNLAEKYSKMNLEDAGGNLAWIIADLAVYEDLYGAELLDENKKKEAMSLIVNACKDFSVPGDLAKTILALKALGYDARNVILESYDKIDYVAELTKLVDMRDASVTNIYTLPYVIIALAQAEEYHSDEQMEYLLQSALESKELWQTVEYGTDAMTPMVYALSACYDQNDDIKAVVDETVELIKNEQREDGLINGFEGYESASTALAVFAFSSLGIDSGEVKNGEVSLVDGLMSAADSELTMFPNAFADEQGLRGLLAWRMLVDNNEKKAYDFSGKPSNVANVGGISNCPVVFEVVPETAVVAVAGEDAISKNCFDLPAGIYEYNVSATGYTATSGRLQITEDEAKNNLKKTVTVSLSKSSSGSSGGGGGRKPSKDKEDKIPQESAPAEDKTQVDTRAEFDEKTFSDVSESDWYYSAVKYAYENNLFSGTDKGFEPDSPMTRAMLVTVLYRLSKAADVPGDIPFSDVQEGKWYTDGVKWAAANNIISGVSDTEFAPDKNVTREQLATIIYRYANSSGYDVLSAEDGDVSGFADGDDISPYAMSAIKYALSAGIISGRDEGLLCPQDGATRAEVASILMRFAGVETK